MRRQARGRSGDDAASLLDGVHLVTAAVDAGIVLEAVLISEAHGPGELAALTRRLSRLGVPLTYASASALDAASPVRSASPVVALARVAPAPLDRVVAGTSPLRLVIIDAVQDPGNVGAIIRTADASGATAVVCMGACADPFGWKALRGAMGSTLRLPVCVEPSTEKTVALLKTAGIQLVALDAGASTSLHDFHWPSRTALAVGTEGRGLDEAHRGRMPTRWCASRCARASSR